MSRVPFGLFWHSHPFINFNVNIEGATAMTIIMNGLKFLVFTAIAGKLICIQHVFAKYNGVILKALENNHEAFSIAATGALTHF